MWHALLMLVALLVPTEPRNDIARLGWLSGCWEGARGQRRFEEQWMRPRGNVMLGMGRVSVGDSIVDFEAMAIIARGGRTYYRAQPNGQPTAEFDAKEVADSSVIFENLEHDFPQRVAYRRAGPDSLVAWIEGSMNGQNRRIEFPLKAVGCSGR